MPTSAPRCWTGFREIGVQSLAEALAAGRPPLVIDVRSPDEYGGGHIEGARNLSLESLSAAVRGGELASDAPVVLICAQGRRSAQACVRLAKVFGFSDVTNIRGGMAAWEDAGLPTQAL